MAAKDIPSNVFIRFSVLNRLLHWVVMVGFFGLALTGFSLKFGSHWWAQAAVFLLGGPERLGYWHRFCAVMTYGGVIVHLGWLVYYKILLKGRLTGPQTLFPSGQDVKDLYQHIGYILGRSKPPRFNRFTYWEKIDYWAILVGMNTMGLTGLVLWFPEFFSYLIPGYFINLAQIIHVYEAIMAVALKFVVHIISAHLRPEVYPIDKTIFNGKTTAERIRQEHPGEWETMKEGVDRP
jgi:formate dehydrogenase gamma subunit